MTNNFIFKTAIVLCSITKRISKMYELEKEQWLSEGLQKHKGSVIYSFIL